jgi:ABC-type sulfate transport system permease component
VGRYKLGVEVMPMNAVFVAPWFPIVVAVFYIFLIWVLWMVVKSLKGVDASLKEIARNGANKL